MKEPHLDSVGPVGAEADCAASYTDMLLSDPSLARRTHDALIEAQQLQGLCFQERMLCTVLRPRFLTTARFHQLSRVSEVLAGLFERAGTALLGSDMLLDRIGASDAERELWSVDPGYPGFTLTSRLDTFLIADTPHVVEYNAESPASIGFCDQLTDIFLHLPAFQTWAGARDLRGFDARRRLTQTLLDAWNAWGGRGAPTMAITDWEDVPTRRDFDLCAESFREQGITAVIADPRRFEYQNGRLWLGDLPIDLVYRRVLLHELLAKSEETQAILRAYREGAICMVNSPRSKLLHKKTVMALLSEGKLGIDLDKDERHIVDETIPWTRQLIDGDSTYDEQTINLPHFVLSHRDRLVLKPGDDYGGRGVVLGWEVSDSQWEKAVEGAVGKAYVVQERVPVARAAFPVWHGDSVDVETLILDTDPLLFAGKVGGILTRMSGSALLNITAGAGSTAPTFVLPDEE
jgi:hypothetical protein